MPLPKALKMRAIKDTMALVADKDQKAVSGLTLAICTEAEKSEEKYPHRPLLAAITM